MNRANLTSPFKILKLSVTALHNKLFQNFAMFYFSWGFHLEFPIKILIRELIQCFAKAVTRRYSVKKVFLEISQNSQENNCARVSF